MPHLIVHTSGNLKGLDESWLLLQANRALMASGLFMDADIKSRVVRCDSFRVGVDSHEEETHAFVAARLAVLSGREFSLREHLGLLLQRTLERCLAGFDHLQVQLTVEVVEIESELYFKSVIGKQTQI
ncbi:MAG TPA: 5-carboxymethyl-2-hydroxymuconate isomerase [Limnobacter sp.]|uniref:5-carboxymethyl-2-hydroxymuconate Delta-isomerase n=1 Tax=Limnobacter sp. TaxID=2003368 RepID=UPI002EDB21CC